MRTHNGKDVQISVTVLASHEVMAAVLAREVASDGVRVLATAKAGSYSMVQDGINGWALVVGGAVFTLIPSAGCEVRAFLLEHWEAAPPAARDTNVEASA